MKQLRPEIDAFLSRGLERGDFPGAAIRIEQRGELLVESAAGVTSIGPHGKPATPKTLFDLASLTKPLATSLLILRRVQQRRLSLTGRLGEVVRRFEGTPAGGATIRQLLTHSSGLPAWDPVYLFGSGRRSFDRRLQELAGQAEKPGTRVVYSDPGYMILGRLLESFQKAKIDSLFRREIARPLALGSIGFNPSASRGSIAATERRNLWEKRMCEERGFRFVSPSIRDSPGIVNDLNSRALGGAAGHAGLFGDAEAVARITRVFLGDDPELLSPRLARRASGDQTSRFQEGRGFGWRTGRGAAAVRGILGDDSFGHEGFTGTSVWCDRGSGRIAVFLTNRIHPLARPIDFQTIRREFHEIAFRS